MFLFMERQSFSLTAFITNRNFIGLWYRIYLFLNTDLILNNAQKTIDIIISFILLFFFYKTFPIIKNSTILFNFTLLLKFALLPVLIYILLPMMQRELKNRLNFFHKIPMYRFTTIHMII